MADETQGWTVVPEPVAPAPTATDVAKSGTNTGLTVAALSKLTPAAAWELMRFGTSPTAAKTGGAIVRGATTLGAAAHGAVTGNLPEIVAAPLEGWAAGKGGYWGTKMLQSAARPVAAVLDKAAPAAAVIAKVGGAQGVNDLAQMAEPGRKDIGVLGVGPSADLTPSPEALKQIPSAVTAAKFLIAKGTTPADAVKQVTGGNPALMGPVMMALMQTRQVK